MQIWVDADACPKVIKEIIFRAAARTKTLCTLVSNHTIASPPSEFIRKLQVTAGFDVADDKIIQNLNAGDLVITADIPLADAAVSKACFVLNPRGEMYTTSNIKERLSLRNFSTSLRDSGVRTRGPATLSKREIQRFSNCLDGLLNQKST